MKKLAALLLALALLLSLAACGGNNGSADLEEMLELFGMEADPELDVSTVNGWVLGVLGRIPKEGEVFQYDKLTAKVTKADERRVIEVEVNAD